MGSFAAPGRRKVLLALLCACLACGEADAQFGGMGRRRGTDDQSGRQAGSDPTTSEITRLSQSDRTRLALTKARIALGLTRDQEAQWQAYQDAVIALLDAQSAAIGSQTLSGRLDEQTGLLKSRLAGFERLRDAAGKLYSVLTDEQRAMADKTLPAAVPAAYPGPNVSPRG
ncbi:MAG: Spy/CpxP family protein refolding chaperone [Betaproteobacteria bacterium]|nr:Spy/CpxP family protein refolding chaperone [Betaproteobacteria bacterium]